MTFLKHDVLCSVVVTIIIMCLLLFQLSVFSSFAPSPTPLELDATAAATLGWEPGASEVEG